MQFALILSTTAFCAHNTYVCFIWFKRKLIISLASRENEPSSSGPQFSHSTEWKLWCAVFGLLWSGPSDLHKMCAKHVRTAVHHSPYNSSKLHLHHSYTKRPWTNGYPPRDIRARKRRPGTARPSSNSDRIKTYQTNKAVWGPGFGHNCQCAIVATPQQTAYSSLHKLRVFGHVLPDVSDERNVFILERRRNQEDRSIIAAVGTSPGWTTLRLSLRRTSVVPSLYSIASLSTNILKLGNLTEPSFKNDPIILDFKLWPCSEFCILSLRWFPDVWILYADVSEHSVPSSYAV